MRGFKLQTKGASPVGAALAVDLSWGMNWVECDPASGIVRCGGGATGASWELRGGKKGG